MLVNREVFPIGRIDPDFKGGLEVFDVSNPSKPTRITTWASRGMHRFTFDGRYAYGSPELDGYLGNVVSIIDFQNPAKPQEVGRWWMPGQWTAGGERPTWEGTAHRCHHPMRVGNRLYIELLARRLRHSQHRRHQQAEIRLGPRLEPALPLADAYRAAGAVSVARPAGHAGRRRRRRASSRTYLAGISVAGGHHRRDQANSVRQFPGRRGRRLAEAGLHRPAPVLRGDPHTEIPIAWFAHGLRVVDIANPHAPKEVASFMPDIPDGAKRVQSNDVCFDDRGLIYLIDRTRGLHILERL